MTAFLVFTEREPMIVMTRRAAVTDGRLVDALDQRGISKFIAYEVPLDRLRNRYGVPFEVIEADVIAGKELRVLDYKGSHVFESISLAELNGCIRHDPQTSA
jgi:hypothetical protein